MLDIITRPSDYGYRPQCSRRSICNMIMSSVYDLRVASAGKPSTIHDKAGTKVEMVTLEIDPVGLFDGDDRAFKDVDVHRIRHQQRVNGGPCALLPTRA